MAGNAVGKRYKPVTRPKVTVYLTPDLRTRALDTVDALSGPPERLSFTVLLERALETEIARLSKKHNHGKPFPPRGGELKRGARPK